MNFWKICSICLIFRLFGILIFLIFNGFINKHIFLFLYFIVDF